MLVITPKNSSGVWNLNENTNFYFKPDGSLGVGTGNTFGYKLAVNGEIGCTKIHVEVVNNWPDYVFSANYKPMSLFELKNYIYKFRKLPGIPSADEINVLGQDVGNIQIELLKKIEELTLYIIQLEERVQKLENTIKNN